MREWISGFLVGVGLTMIAWIWVGLIPQPRCQLYIAGSIESAQEVAIVDASKSPIYPPVGITNFACYSGAATTATVTTAATIGKGWTIIRW